MNYYDLLYDYENEKSTYFITFNESLLSFGRYDINRGNYINTEPIEIDEKIKENTIISDYISNNLAWFMVTEKFKNLLQDFNIGETQFIPVIKLDSKEIIGYIVNVISVLDALDLDNSMHTKIKYDDNGEEKYYISIIKYALKEDKLENRDLVCLKDKFHSIFISEKLKKAMIKAKITGCDYTKVKVT